MNIPRMSGGENLTTSWSTPYALIKRGGAAVGRRPFTTLAFITRAVARDGTIIGLKCRLVYPDWRPRTKERDLEEEAIVRQWRMPPSRAAITRARKALPPTPAFDGIRTD